MRALDMIKDDIHGIAETHNIDPVAVIAVRQQQRCVVESFGIIV